MADTVLTSDSEKRLYQENLFISSENDALWSKFTGGMDATSEIVQVDNRPELSGGARADYGIRPYIKPSSVTNGPLDGQEIKLEFYYDNLTLDQHRQAVIDAGKKQKVKAFFSIDDAQERYIKEWLTQMYDALHFKAVLSETSGNANYFYQGSATSEDTLTANDTNGTDALSSLFTIAQTGKSRTFEPIRPYMYDGEEYYVYMCHPDEWRDIRLDLEPFWKDAMPRSSDNPLFKRAKAVWSNIICMTDRRMPIKRNSNSIAISTGVLLGQQAVQQIRGEDFNIVEGSKDWGNQNGYAAEFIVGCKAPEFNSKRYGSILVKSARTNISGNDNLAEINYNNIKTSNQ